MRHEYDGKNCNNEGTSSITEKMMTMTMVEVTMMMMMMMMMMMTTMMKMVTVVIPTHAVNISAHPRKIPKRVTPVSNII